MNDPALASDGFAVKNDTVVAGFPDDLGRGIGGYEAWLAVAPPGAAERIRAQAAAAERSRIRHLVEAHRRRSCPDDECCQDELLGHMFEGDRDA